MSLSYSFLFAEHSFNSQAGRYAAEDLVAGMRRSGQMSAVRRFFCLLVTFDLLFTSLLWLIVILVCIILVEACNISLPEVNRAIPCATSYIRITFHLFCHSFHKCDVREESSGLMLSFEYDLANNPHCGCCLFMVMITTDGERKVILYSLECETTVIVRQPPI